MNLCFTILISGGVLFVGGIKIVYEATYEGSLSFYAGIFFLLLGLFCIYEGFFKDVYFK